MRTREMPDWMMDYVAAIDNNDCYQEFRDLSSSYYNEISDYHQNIYPQQNMNNWAGNKTFGKENINLDPAPKLHSLEEKFKEKSLDIACKYGYKKPDKEKVINDKEMTGWQEKSPEFKKILNGNNKQYGDLSLFDEMANEAHKAYFDTHPEAKDSFEQNREKWQETEKFDIELEQKGNLADRFIDELYSSKNGNEKWIEPEKTQGDKKEKSKEER